MCFQGIDELLHFVVRSVNVLSAVSAFCLPHNPSACRFSKHNPRDLHCILVRILYPFGSLRLEQKKECGEKIMITQEVDLCVNGVSLVISLEFGLSQSVV